MMAGIGYKLKALVKEDTYTNLARGYLYSAVISSGPWLFTVLCLLFLFGSVEWVTGQPRLFNFVDVNVSKDDLAQFQIIVIYTFAFSLVFTGFMQMVVARALSDTLFSGDTKKLIPSFVTVLALVAAVGFAMAAVFYAFTELNLELRITGAVLYTVISCTWIAMIFLGVARDYNSIFLAFLVGTITSFAAGYLLGAAWGLLGLLVGFTAGQLLILAILVARTLSEFEGAVTISADILRSFNVYPTLALIGFFYNLGIWEDKFFFMFGPSGTLVSKGFYSNSLYTTPLFAAYMTIVPTLALFVIRVETSFHEVYRRYYGTILAKRPLGQIEQVRLQMADNVKLSMARVLKLQGAVSLLAIVFAEPIAAIVGMKIYAVPIFRVAVLASLMQAVLLILVISLLYLDQRMRVLLLSAIFFVSNGLLTAFAALVLGPAFDGYGYAASCLLSACIGYLMLEQAVARLNYYTFMHQPVAAKAD